MYNDNKSLYSSASKEYLDKIDTDEDLKRAHDSSKSREAKYNENWLLYPVDINELVDRYAPNSSPTFEGRNKYTWYGTDYDVVCDMSAGYCRIRVHGTEKYIALDGSHGYKTNSHFKIKKREEM